MKKGTGSQSLRKLRKEHNTFSPFWQDSTQTMQIHWDDWNSWKFFCQVCNSFLERLQLFRTWSPGSFRVKYDYRSFSKRSCYCSKRISWRILSDIFKDNRIFESLRSLSKKVQNFLTKCYTSEQFYENSILLVILFDIQLQIRCTSNDSL